MTHNEKYKASELIEFTSIVFQQAGMQKNMARITAKTLVDGDLMGYTTHGLNLLPGYMEEIEKGDMKVSGTPETVRDMGQTITWKGDYLPGPWLVHEAIDLALERIKEFPVVTVSIGTAHHIGCLSSYPERATTKNLMMLLACSDPRNKTVAPYGGTDPVYSPDPLAVGIPTVNGPIVFDTSMSSTANGVVIQKHKMGEKLPGKWLQKRSGEITDDPSEAMKTPAATLLPLGGMDLGFKGFALGILIEALTSGLAGHGRADQPGKWGSSVFLQIIDPAGFGGREAFLRETSYFSRECLESSPVQPDKPVRLPGSRAFQLREKQFKEGVWLHPSFVPDLKKVAKKYKVDFPELM